MVLLIVPIVVCMCLIPVLITLWLSVLRSRQANLLWFLAIAAGNSRRLPIELEDLAKSHVGFYRRRLWDLANMLHEGSSLSGALEAIPGLLPPATKLRIRLAEESQALIPTLREEALRAAIAAQRDMATENSSSAYISYGMTFAVLISSVTFLMVFIVPKFKKIFEGFDTELPTATITLIQFSDFAANYWYLGFPILALMILASIAGVVGGITQLRWGIDRLFPTFHAPTVLEGLATVAAAGRPLTAGLGTMAEAFPRPHMRARLAGVLNEVEAGGDCFTKLQERGVIRRSHSELAHSAQRAGNLAWALRQLANVIRLRQNARFKVIVQCLQPFALLLLAGVVAFVEIALFIPLVKLLEDLSSLDSAMFENPKCHQQPISRNASASGSGSHPIPRKRRCKRTPAD